MCDTFSTPADKIHPDLHHALVLLELTSITDLEERFLATTAFLAPWSTFRDSCLLVPNSHSCKPCGITRQDILWFYTQFNEGLRRHDPRTEQPGATFEIDKRKWGPSEHEKHLYAWLLQSFCVGKSYSQFGLRYLQLKNVCTAWEEVFVPIVKAVRASYSMRGRRYYGRLALFVEERCPSRLAFPEGNVSMPSSTIDSPTPFRVVSRLTRICATSQTVLTKKNYDEAERDLRDVYPQFGGLVERPRFKKRMEDWLEIQRIRAAYRKTIPKPEVVKYVTKSQPDIVELGESKNIWSPTKSSSPELCSDSHPKRYSESIRSSSLNIGSIRVGKSELPPLSSNRAKTLERPKVSMIPYGMYSYVPRIPRDEPKSPLHGVTRQILTPDASDQEGQLSNEEDLVRKAQPDNEDVWPLPTTRLARPRLPKYRRSEQSVFSAGRNSIALNDVTPAAVVHTDNPEKYAWSPMGALSAIPSPLEGPDIRDEPIPQTLLETNRSYSEARHPNYESNGYEREISLTDLHLRKINPGTHVMRSDLTTSKLRNRLPAPIKVPPPCVGQLHVELNDTYRNTKPRAAAALQSSNSSETVVWPALDGSWPGHLHAAYAFTTPISTKSPGRWATRRGQRSEYLLLQNNLSEDMNSHEMLRIVSKENIRATLGNLTPETSIEDLRAQAARLKPMRITKPATLETYNKHMFPRKTERSNKP